jgi:hypothetical protein
MKETAKDQRIESTAAALSFAVPLAWSAWSAGASMSFFDAPELAAAAHGIGVTHPPGHPLWVTCAALATLLPVATVPYRIALMSGLFLAVIGRVVYGISRQLAASALDDEQLSSTTDHYVGIASALAMSLSATLGPAVLRQATRSEVYALAGALVVGVLATSCARTLSTARRARMVVLLTALGGANHHFIALTALPLALSVVVERLRTSDNASRLRALSAWAPLGFFGMLPYTLLFLRADTSASLVAVRTFGDFFWTISARAFQKNMAGGVPGTFGEHMLGVLEWIGISLTPFALLMAVAGTFLLLRTSKNEASRHDVLRLFGLATCVALARAILGFVSGNPDAAGYLLPCVISVACLATGFPTVAWRAIRLSPAHPKGPTPGARKALVAMLVLLPMALPIYIAYAGYAYAIADRAFVAEAAAESSLAALPPRTVVLAYAPETVFRLRYAQRVDGERPDVTVVPVPFLPYPGMYSLLLAHDPDLLPIVRDYLTRGEANASAIATLASQRPMRVEINPRNVLSMLPLLVPRGLLAEARGEPTTLASVRTAAVSHFASLDALLAAMGEEPGRGHDDKTNEFVLWRSYNDSLFFAARGARPEAARSLRTALSRAPTSTELLGLQSALAAPGEGMVDVRSFVVGPAQSH